MAFPAHQRLNALPLPEVAELRHVPPGTDPVQGLHEASELIEYAGMHPSRFSAKARQRLEWAQTYVLAVLRECGE